MDYIAIDKKYIIHAYMRRIQKLRTATDAFQTILRKSFKHVLKKLPEILFHVYKASWIYDQTFL